MAAMVQGFDGVRELSVEEMEAVVGGWVWAVAGAVGGGLMATADALSDDGRIDGGEALGIAGSALTGAVGGRVVDLAVRALRKK